MQLPALCALPKGALENAANSVNCGCANMTRTAEQTTMRKVYLRLLPFSILCMSCATSTGSMSASPR